MRVWDLHPGYLSRGNLLGQHAEIHALFAVITGGGAPYAAHPETIRWRGHQAALGRRHDLTVLEMRLRGYRHHSPLPVVPAGDAGCAPGFVDHPLVQVALLADKCRQQGRVGRIPLPVTVLDFWAHHEYSIMARGCQHYRALGRELSRHGDGPIADGCWVVELVLRLLELPVTEPALSNTVGHLWRGVRPHASIQERRRYLDMVPDQAPERLRLVAELAGRYGVDYLLSSTVLADFTDRPLSA